MNDSFININIFPRQLLSKIFTVFLFFMILNNKKQDIMEFELIIFCFYDSVNKKAENMKMNVIH